MKRRDLLKGMFTMSLGGLVSGCFPNPKEICSSNKSIYLAIGGNNNKKEELIRNSIEDMVSIVNNKFKTSGFDVEMNIKVLPGFTEIKDVNNYLKEYPNKPGEIFLSYDLRKEILGKNNVYNNKIIAISTFDESFLGGFENAITQGYDSNQILVGLFNLGNMSKLCKRNKGEQYEVARTLAHEVVGHGIARLKHVNFRERLMFPSCNNAGNKLSIEELEKIRKGMSKYEISECLRNNLTIPHEPSLIYVSH